LTKHRIVSSHHRCQML